MSTPVVPAALGLAFVADLGRGSCTVLVDDDLPPRPAPRPGLTFVTHRFDAAARLREEGHPCDFGVVPADARSRGSQVVVACRVPKEKALARLAVDRAATWLRPGGALVLLGRKTEGIESLRKEVARAWGVEPTIERDGPWRRVRFARPSEAPPDLTEPFLPTVQGTWRGLPWYGMPGVFSWKRLDRGTELLLEVLPQPQGRWLDLGCGTGLLAAWLARAADVVATDSNAFALRCTRATLGEGRGAVVPSDAGDGIEGPFDGVACNPPFHRGAGTDAALTTRFATAASRVLRPGGEAWFVVNAFVPLEREAVGLFESVQPVCQDGSYRVIRARR